MRALLIEFDLKTGERAGGINPKDPHLPCKGWQDLEKNPAIEIRLVTDERDLSQYRGTKGITVLEGKDAINRAIQTNLPVRYAITDRSFLLEHIKEKGVSLSSFAGKSDQEIAKECFERGLLGVREIKPRLLED
jgi:hypothetical protein